MWKWKHLIHTLKLLITSMLPVEIYRNTRILSHGISGRLLLSNLLSVVSCLIKYAQWDHWNRIRESGWRIKSETDRFLVDNDINIFLHPCLVKSCRPYHSEVFNKLFSKSHSDLVLSQEFLSIFCFFIASLE